MEQEVRPLYHYVLKTLENLEKWEYPKLELEKNDKNIFLGSGSAGSVAKLFVEKFNGIALNTSNYKRFFERVLNKDFASVNIISASGGKDSITMAKFLNEKGIIPNLITCNDDPPAKEFVNKIFVFPSFREPPTYNVSTYSSMIYFLFKENLEEIRKLIENLEIPNLRKYKYIFFLAEDKYEVIAEMACRKVAETLEGIGSNGEGFSNASHGMLRQPNKDRLVFCLNFDYEDENENIFKLMIDSYLGLLLATYYIIGKNQTEKDTENLLKDYKKVSEKLGWKFSKMW